jgi:hypothetical protein
MQRQKVIPLLATAAAAFLGCETLPTPTEGLAVAAQGKGAVQQQVPYADTVLDCDSQALALSGALHVVSRIRQDGQGRYHAMLHANFQDLIGIDAAGDTLTGGGAAQVNGKLDSLPGSFSDTLEAILVSADAEDTVEVDFGITWTLNADGSVTATLSDPVTACEPDTTAPDTGVGTGT